MNKKLIGLAERFRLAVDSIYLTRADAAKDLGISAPQVGNIMSGNAGIGIKTIGKLEKVGINSDWVLHGKGKMLLDPRQSRFYEVFVDMLDLEHLSTPKEQEETEQEAIVKEQKEVLKEQKEVLKEQRALVLELRAANLRARED